MKVLDANPESCGWSMETYCTGYGWDQEGREPCGAKLEVADKDLRYRTHTDISGVTDGYFIMLILNLYKLLKMLNIVERRNKYESYRC